jgi:hypothetical protein
MHPVIIAVDREMFRGHPVKYEEVMVAESVLVIYCVILVALGLAVCG